MGNCQEAIKHTEDEKNKTVVATPSQSQLRSPSAELVHSAPAPSRPATSAASARAHYCYSFLSLLSFLSFVRKRVHAQIKGSL